MGAPLSVALLFTAGLLLGPGLLTVACSGDTGSSTTGGRRFALKTRATAGAEATSGFRNAEGWSVKLSKAALSLGPFYYFDGAPIFSQAAPRSRRTRALAPSPWLWLDVKSAWAHPGHYVAGNALGQMTIADSVDLMAGVTDLAPGEGVTGTVRSARFVFASPPRGKAAALLDGHVVVVEGVATKGAESRAFRGVGDLADVLDSYGEPKAEGCPFTEAAFDDAGTVTVTIKPSVWLDQVDFSKVRAATGETPKLEGEPQNAFTRGLKKGFAYQFSYSK